MVMARPNGIIYFDIGFILETLVTCRTSRYRIDQYAFSPDIVIVFVRRIGPCQYDAIVIIIQL